jgi:hypothetical protein
MPKNNSSDVKEIDLVNRDPHDMNDYLQVMISESQCVEKKTLFL